MDIEQRLRDANRQSQQYAAGSTLLIEAADKIKELRGYLLDCERIQLECVSEEGLCDAIDNDGEMYQSQGLAMLIEEARQENWNNRHDCSR